MNERGYSSPAALKKFIGKKKQYDGLNFEPSKNGQNAECRPQSPKWTEEPTEPLAGVRLHSYRPPGTKPPKIDQNFTESDGQRRSTSDGSSGNCIFGINPAGGCLHNMPRLFIYQ